MNVQERVVAPLCMQLLHGNLRSEGPTSAIVRDLKQIAESVTDAELAQLLDAREWRGRLCAGWCVGAGQRKTFRARLGELLLASEVPYAGQGYCVGLALLGGSSSVQHLENYLRAFLPISDRPYDQDWAFGALTTLDPGAAVPFADPGQWQYAGSLFVHPRNASDRFGRLMAFLRTAGLTSAA